MSSNPCDYMDTGVETLSLINYTSISFAVVVSRLAVALFGAVHFAAPIVLSASV